MRSDTEHRSHEDLYGTPDRRDSLSQSTGITQVCSQSFDIVTIER